MGSAGPARGQIYKYTDDRGHTVFTNDLSQVPPDKRSEALEYEEVKTPVDKDAGSTETELNQVLEEFYQEETEAETPEPEIDRETLKAERLKLEDEYQNLLEEKQALERDKALALKRYNTKKDKSRYRTLYNKLSRQIRGLEPEITDYRNRLRKIDATLGSIAEEAPGTSP